jgi:NAD(P)-dependent dehydrogenase (short-subunit alcohol dehydrogenase family)
MARPLLLITGIAEGFGAEIATAFARAGHDVLGLSRTDRASAQIRQAVERQDGHYTHLACDVTSPGDIVSTLASHAARIDILIHNAHLLAIRPFEQTTAVEFEQVWRVACFGAMLSAQAVIPHMAARGQGHDHLHRRYRRHPRRRQIFGVCFGQICAARAGAIARTRVRSRWRACRPSRARRLDRRGSD